MPTDVNRLAWWPSRPDASVDGPPPDGTGHRDLSMPFAVDVAERLCFALRLLAAGDLQGAAEALDEEARHVERVCCDAERHRLVTPVESLVQVRDLVLTYIPAVLRAALDYGRHGQLDAALTAVQGIPSGLWKSASYLYEEASRRSGAPFRRAQRPAFYEGGSANNLAIITAALEELLRSEAVEHVVCQVVGEGPALRFHETTDGEIVLQLDFDGLNPAQFRRAEVFFANMEGEKQPARFLIRLGRDVDAGARLAVAVLHILYGVDADADLTVEVI